MKRTLSTLAFAILVILLFIGAYLSWLHKGEPERLAEESVQSRIMEDAAKKRAQELGR
jgi:hypothetical protein